MQKMQDELQPCNYEEANYRLLLHKYVSQKRFRKLSIITIDTEVVVIKLYHFFFSLHFNELLVEFGGQHGNNIQYMQLHAL